MQFGIALVFLVVWLLILWFGAIALQASGMERRKARFQALSALTGSGFTTREAEDVVSHPRRRTIISWLMFFGNAGIVLFIIFIVFYLSTSFTSASPARIGITVAPIVVLLALIFSGATDKLGSKIANRWKRSGYFASELSSTEILHQSGDYSAARLTIGSKSPEVGCKISDTSLAKHEINILAIERGDKTLAFPEAGEVVQAGDHLLCYGKTAEISRAVQ